MRTNRERGNDIKTEKEISVERVKELDFGIFFDLIVNGVTIYGCRIVTGRNKEEFIGFPSHKGKDGKYYKHAYVDLTDAETAKIMDLVDEALA